MHVARKARDEVTQDEKLFDRVWDRLSRDQNAHLHLRKIDQISRANRSGSDEIFQRFQSGRLDATCTNDTPPEIAGKVLVVQNAPALLKTKNKFFHSTFIEKARAEQQVFRVSNLDQLYAQAVLVYPLFLRK
eukprot:195145-Hanusia_phi.AAC.2